MAWDIQKENRIKQLREEEEQFWKVEFPEIESKLRTLGLTIHDRLGLINNATEIRELLAPFSRTTK